jgi:hypothetical protein
MMSRSTNAAVHICPSFVNSSVLCRYRILDRCVQNAYKEPVLGQGDAGIHFKEKGCRRTPRTLSVPTSHPAVRC